MLLSTKCAVVTSQSLETCKFVVNSERGTRNQAIKVVQILRSGHELKGLQQFPGFLPTTKQGICRVVKDGH